MKRATKRKVMVSKTMASGSPYEVKAGPFGHGVRQNMDVVPSTGQGPGGTCAVMIPFGAAPAVPPPPVGAGKGFKGW